MMLNAEVSSLASPSHGPKAEGERSPLALPVRGQTVCLCERQLGSDRSVPMCTPPQAQLWWLTDTGAQGNKPKSTQSSRAGP